MEEIFIADYTYTLPPHRVADVPSAERDASRLLQYKQGTISDHAFSDLPRLLQPSMQLILNNTRVLPARIHFQKTSGGVIEIFCLEPATLPMANALAQTETVEWICLVGGASKWKSKQVLLKEVLVAARLVAFTAEWVSKNEDGFTIRFSWPGGSPFSGVLDAAGAVPLPPYIKRKAEVTDAARYQTIFNQQAGSVAAPTAALHFTQPVFDRLAGAGITLNFVTLHVGAGTFQPVKSVTIAGHPMHAENFSVTKNALQALLKAESIAAVGTTSLRTLESLHWMGVKLLTGAENPWTLFQWEAYELNETVTFKESIAAILDFLQQSGMDEITCRTALLIRPGYRFKTAVALVTNFHQPQSTLLLLVAAFIGDDWRKVYQHALNNGYRFLSYGDSSLLWRSDAGL